MVLVFREVFYEVFVEDHLLIPLWHLLRILTSFEWLLANFLWLVLILRPGNKFVDNIVEQFEVHEMHRSKYFPEEFVAVR